jgi:hypothetical protein
VIDDGPAKECTMTEGIRILVLSAVVAAGASSTAAAAVDEGAQYHVRDVLVGSVVAQDIIDSPMPFDSTYAELTPDQKAVLFQDYESLSPGDEPPFPLYGIRHLVRPLVPFVETWNPTGSLVASVDVDSKGDAQSVTVYKSPDPQLARLASKAMALEKYKPGVCHGQPCRMQYLLRLDFPNRRATPVTVLPLRSYDQP